MSGGERNLTLTVTTPMICTVDCEGVRSLRAQDASGDFGILPGHADLLTVLGPSVLRWQRGDGRWHFCALRGGVMRVSGGRRVDIACREAVTGDDLVTLSALVKEQLEAREDAARRARAEQTRLHANAIRSLMRHLHHGSMGAALMESLQ